MATTVTVINAPIEKVFEVLADGWAYGNWVVGTAHVIDVDEDWPEPGSRIRVETGGWPALKRAETVVVERQAPSRLVLRPRMWPLGELTVTLTLVAEAPRKTAVEMREEITAGPMRWLRVKLDDLFLHRRNEESLRRLADLAERGGPQ